jgi:hypothetical protein
MQGSAIIDPSGPRPADRSVRIRRDPGLPTRRPVHACRCSARYEALVADVPDGECRASPVSCFYKYGSAYEDKRPLERYKARQYSLGVLNERSRGGNG